MAEEKKEELDITEEQFKAYEEVRASGVTNMFNVGLVSELSGLDRRQIIKIMSGYKLLMQMYPKVRKTDRQVINGD